MVKVHLAIGTDSTMLHRNKSRAPPRQPVTMPKSNGVTAQVVPPAP